MLLPERKSWPKRLADRKMQDRARNDPAHSRTCQRPPKTCLKIFLLAGFLVLGVSRTLSQQRTLSIQGQVHSGNGTPLPDDVTVRLEAAEEVSVTQQYVGANGKFEFDNLKGGLYRLTVTAKGYKTATQDVDMHYFASRYPNIYLLPEDTKVAAAPSSHTVASTDLAAPKKARKEYEKGLRSLQDGNSADARSHLEKAVEDYPCYARALASLGVALCMQNQFAPAETTLRKALTCDSGYLEAYIQLAILLSAQGKFAESQADLQAALGHFPGEWQLYFQLGSAEGGAGKFAEAERAFSKAESLNPALPPEFHLKVAALYMKWKQYFQARAEMQAYLAADPTGRFSAETRNMIKRLESSGMLSSTQGKTGQLPR